MKFELKAEEVAEGFETLSRFFEAMDQEAFELFLGMFQNMYNKKFPRPDCEIPEEKPKRDMFEDFSTEEFVEYTLEAVDRYNNMSHIPKREIYMAVRKGMTKAMLEDEQDGNKCSDGGLI